MLQRQEKNQADSQLRNSQKFHQQAAVLHELASKHHTEAGKHYESGDDSAAAHHAELAHGYARQAIDQNHLLDHRPDRREHDHKKLLDTLTLTSSQEVAWNTLVQSEQAMAPRHAKADEKLSMLAHEENMLLHLQKHVAHLNTHIAAIKAFYAVITSEQKMIFDDFHANMRFEHDKLGRHTPGADKAPLKPKH